MKRFSELMLPSNMTVPLRSTLMINAPMMVPSIVPVPPLSEAQRQAWRRSLVDLVDDLDALVLRAADPQGPSGKAAAEALRLLDKPVQTDAGATK